MNPLIKKILFWGIGLFTFLAITVFIIDVLIMPWYVETEEVTVPNLVGKNFEEAIIQLKDSSLNPIISDPRYSDNVPENHVIYQNPEAGKNVKVNRRVNLVVSAGNPLTKMPNLIGKTVREAKVIIQRLGFSVDNIEEIRSDEKANTIIEQFPEEGTNLAKGTFINFKVSIGPQMGMVKVPDLIGMTFTEAENILRQNSLIVGKINYQNSPNMLPNTIVAQYPTQNELISIGEQVDLFITKN